jgi:hypothetical protein
MQFVRELQQLLAQRCNGGGQVLAAAPVAAGDTGRTQQLAQLLLQEVQGLLQVGAAAVNTPGIRGSRCRIDQHHPAWQTTPFHCKPFRLLPKYI